MPVLNTPTPIVGGPASARWNDWQTVFETPGFASPNESQPKSDEKLEKNSSLDYYKDVNLREEVIAILKSGKSVEEKADLLVAVIGPSPNNDISSQNKIDFKAAATVDPGPLPKNPVRYADRKAHPQYANLNAVEFLRAVWGNTQYLKQSELRSYDPKLIAAIHSLCQQDAKRPVELRVGYVASEILPESSRSRPVELQNLTPGTIEYVRAYDRLRKAKHHTHG